jgi:exonuclease III
MAAGQPHLVLAGDFNFVESPLDRARSEGALARRDRVPAAAMAALVEDVPLRDAYRLRHPTTTGFTLTDATRGSRADQTTGLLLCTSPPWCRRRAGRGGRVCVPSSGQTVPWLMS